MSPAPPNGRMLWPKRAQHRGGAAAAVEAIVRPVVEGMSLRLWDVRLEKEGPRLVPPRSDRPRHPPLDTRHLRGGLPAQSTRCLMKPTPIDQSYYLEVGSPGLGRKLTPARAFRRPGRPRKCAARLIRPDEQGPP